MRDNQLRRRYRRAATAAALAVGTALAPVLLPGAQPGAGAAPAEAQPIQLRDHAGSSIAKREGNGPEPASAPRVSRPSPTTESARVQAQLRGLDVSGHQKNVDWDAVRDNGARFAYVKATEGTSYTSPYFAQQYNGSYDVGLIRGAYHFALPDNSSGSAQAEYFVNHGGGWSADGKTLPPALDIEYNPYGSTCYGKTDSQMVRWIRDFSSRVFALTDKYPTIYTTTSWWRQCTGNSSAFAATNPLWVARYNSTVGTLPDGWSYYTFWQYNDHGTFPGDQNYFNGSYQQLKALATNSDR